MPSFPIASLDETELGKLAEAIDRFKKITVEPWHSQARQRIAVMESKSLVVVTPRTFRSGETAFLKIATRNIEDSSFHGVQAQRRSLFPQEERARESRVARHRSGRARRLLDQHGPGLRPVQAVRYRISAQEARAAGRLRRQGD